MNHQDRKKALKAKFKEMKPLMGVYVIRSKDTGQCYIEAAKNLPGIMNSARFKLDGGMFVNSNLQEAWAIKGEKNFDIEILDTLDYDEDELKTDYTEELLVLKKIWEEKLIAEGWQLY